MLLKTMRITERRFNPRYPGLVALLFGILLTVIIFIFAEIIFGFLNRYISSNNIEISISSKSLKMQDKEIGYKLIPGVKLASVKSVNNDLLYAVSYSTDKYGRRITPQERTEDRNKYALFFGCSYTFGTGINDNETLPYYFSKFTKDYKSYNYGVGGYGTQQMLIKLNDENLRNEIKEKEGILIYRYEGFHILRVIGSSSICNEKNELGCHMPYFKLKEGFLVRSGDFTSAKPILSGLYKLVNKSQIVKYFKIYFPLWITENHIKLTVKVIEECRNAYRAKFGNENFYVFMESGPYKNNKRLIHYLKKADIKYIDYSKFLTEHGKKNKLQGNYFRIKGDGHPTAKLNKLIARSLVQDLALGKQ